MKHSITRGGKQLSGLAWPKLVKVDQFSGERASEHSVDCLWLPAAFGSWASSRLGVRVRRWNGNDETTWQSRQSHHFRFTQSHNYAPRISSSRAWFPGGRTAAATDGWMELGLATSGQGQRRSRRPRRSSSLIERKIDPLNDCEFRRRGTQKTSCPAV